MHTQDETLSPQQQCFVAAILLIIFLAFSSVFAFAYVKGSQVRKARVNVQAPERVYSHRFNNLGVQDVKSRCIRATRGARVQLPLDKEFPGLHRSRVWTISKFPQDGQSGVLLNPSIISYITSPGAWRVSRQGVLTIPSDGEPGFYQVHYWSKRRVRDYFFEVGSEQ